MTTDSRNSGSQPSLEEHLHRVIESAPFVLWAVDERGMITLSEGQALTGLGLKPGQLVGASVFDVYRDSPVVVEHIKRCLLGEEMSWEVEVNGRIFESRTFPRWNDAREVVGLLGVSTDVTEHKRREEEARKLQEQMQQVQKLESLGVLAGGIAHDFNNLLTAIMGSTSVALRALPEGHPGHVHLDNVMTASSRAAYLTKQLLAYAGKGTFEITRIDLSAHVRELVTVLETTLPKKVQVRLELNPDLPAIQADAGQVQQIIMNLVINGADAIGEERGTVLITTGSHDIDDVYAQSLFAGEGLVPGRYVFLEVHDTGCGMDEATKAKIFDPFFTTKFQGRGLGLAATLGIVRSHRGALKVYSSPGRGSTFKVFFPAVEGEVTKPLATAPHFRGKGLVLVIDDDEGVRNAVSSLLGYFGFSVIEAIDGRHGVQTFAEHAKECVLVLLDMTMPELGGEEVFREIRRIRADVPVILTSGYNEIEATRRFTSKGLAGFLQKPFTPAELAQRLRAALVEEAAQPTRAPDEEK